MIHNDRNQAVRSGWWLRIGRIDNCMRPDLSFLSLHTHRLKMPYCDTASEVSYLKGMAPYQVHEKGSAKSFLSATVAHSSSRTTRAPFSQNYHFAPLANSLTFCEFLVAAECRKRFKWKDNAVGNLVILSCFEADDRCLQFWHFRASLPLKSSSRVNLFRHLSRLLNLNLKSTSLSVDVPLFVSLSRSRDKPKDGSVILDSCPHDSHITSDLISTRKIVDKGRVLLLRLSCFLGGLSFTPV